MQPGLDKAHEILFDYLKGNPKFVKAVKTGVKKSYRKALEYLKDFQEEIVEFCQENKKLSTELSRLCSISIIREGVVKLGFNYPGWHF